MSVITVAIAGSTRHTVRMAETLASDSRFSVPWVLTPVPKPIGRKQKVTANPLHQWADSHGVPTVLIEHKIDKAVQAAVLHSTKPDILLVVDFGYMVPNWLLKLPIAGPINIHPSLLPRWRGSSPGQFVLVSGEITSAVTILVVTPELDSGPIVFQEMFAVDPQWTQTEYYEAGFTVAAKHLPSVLLNFATDPSRITPQPGSSPTPIARRLSKQDSFAPWEAIVAAMNATSQTSTTTLELTMSADIATQPLLETLIRTTSPTTHPHLFEQAVRGLSPWPMVWTEIATAKGVKKMQLCRCSISSTGALTLGTVKIEGLPEKPWSEVKNQILQ